MLTHKPGLRFNPSLFSKLLGASALAVSSPSFAQSDQVPAQSDTSSGGGLAEIIVVAQKRAENLQEVPISITALSGDRLVQSGVIDTSQLSSAVAGLSIKAVAQGFSPTIRGIGTTSFGPSLEVPVALVVDDVYYVSPLMGLGDMSDVAQVAVLKGPQGTLFGRNATGGVIQLNTRAPSADFSGEVRSELDNYLTSRNFAYVTGGVADGLNANLSVKFTAQDKGWGKNILYGTDIHRINHALSVRNKWSWEVQDGTDIRLNFDYTDTKNSLGLNSRPVPGSFAPYNTINNPGVKADEWDSEGYTPTLNHLKHGGASLAIDHDTGFGSIMSITAYRKFHNNFQQSSGGTPFPIVETLPSVWKGDQFTQELRLLSKSNQPLTWQIGAFYVDASDGFDPIIDLNNTTGSIYSYSTLSRFKTESYAFFGQSSFDFGQGTRITGGLRYTKEKRSVDAQHIYTSLSDGPTPPDFFLDDSISESKWTFRAALDHKFTDDILAYASFNRGFKSGGFDPFVTQAQPYKAEVLDAYEIGLKTELLDRRLRLNPSAFFYKYDNIQVTFIQSGLTYVSNAASAEIYGVDVDLELQATEELNISGGLEWLHSTFSDYPNAPTNIADPTYVLLPGVIPNASGNRLPYSPKISYNIALDYRTEVAGGELHANLSDSFTGQYATEPDNRLKVKSMHILNAALDYTFADSGVTVGLFGRNILNKAVPSFLASFAYLGDVASYENAPATYGASIRFKFGKQD